MKEKKRHWLLTALGQLATWLLDAVEYVSHSSSWKKFFRMFLSMGAVVLKGGSHG